MTTETSYTPIVLIGFLLVFMAPLFHIAAAADAYIQAEEINSVEVRSESNSSTERNAQLPE